MAIVNDWEITNQGAREKDYNSTRRDKYYYADYADGKPSEKQLAYAKKIAKKLKCREPDYTSRADVNMFIKLNETEFLSACKNSRKKKTS